MVKIYRLRQGRFTWSHCGAFEVRKQVSGRIGLPSVEPDRETWRMMIPLSGSEGIIKISARLDEPEFATLAQALSDVSPDDNITLCGTGQLLLPDGSPSPLIPPLEAHLSDLLDLADQVIARMRSKAMERWRIAVSG